MPTSRDNGGGGFMADETRFNVGALQQRVSGVEQGLQALAASTAQQINGVSAQISSLASKLDERSRTPWNVVFTALGVIVSFMVVVGGLAYWPIQNAVARIETTVSKQQDVLTAMSEKLVSVRELDARTARGQTDFARINGDIKTLEANIVPRLEHAERWRSNETQLQNIQRQIDETNKRFGDTFSLRDALQQMQRRIDQLESRRP